MYTAKGIRLGVMFFFAWKSIVIFLLYAILITAAYDLAGLHFIGLPFVPLGVIGTAVAFYVGFKNNSSYERLWEARKIWGSIVNLSRCFGSFTMSYTEPKSVDDKVLIENIRTELIYRHLAFINALRIRLRNKSTWNVSHNLAEEIVERETSFHKETGFDELVKLLPAREADEVLKASNPVSQILHTQTAYIRQLHAEGYISDLREVEFGRLIKELYDQQGACERIKTFPFPRQYGHFSKVFVAIFILLLPFGLVAEFAKLGEGLVWLTVPFHVLIAWVFNTMEVVGDTSENPFEGGINDVPMSAICRTIEIDLREMLGEEHGLKPLLAVNNILM